MKTIRIFLFMILIPLVSRSEWIHTNGPYGGNVNCFVQVINYLFTGTWGGGVFRSADNGFSWAEANNGIDIGTADIRSLAVYQDMVFASGGGLYRSTDHGDSWTNVGSPVTGGAGAMVISGTSIFLAGGNGLFRGSVLDTGWTYLGLAGVPITGLAAVGGGTVWVGTQNGILRGTAPGNFTTIFSGHEINSFAFADLKIYAGSSYSGVFVSEDGGDSWIAVNVGLVGGATTLAVSGNTLYAGSNMGVCKADVTTNINWSTVNTGLTYPCVQNLYATSGGIFAGTCGGIFRLSGSSWTMANNGLRATFAFPETNQGFLYAGTHDSRDGVYSSQDFGNTWNHISNGLNNYDNALLNIGDMEFSPGMLYAATDAGVHASADNGSSWFPAGDGLPCSFISCLAVTGSTIYAGCSFGVYKASTGSLLWSAVSDSTPPPDITVLHLPAPNMLYAGTYDHGIYRLGVAGAWGIDCSGTGNLHVYGFASNTSFTFAATSDGVYRTSGSSGWELLTFPGYTGECRSIVNRGDTLYACAYTGIAYSVNNGNSWTFVGSSVFNGSNTIAIGNGFLYAGTGGTGIWRRALSEFHTCYLNSDTLVLKKSQFEKDSLFVECDTSWSISGERPGWLSVSPVSGSGNGYIVFRTEAPNDEPDDRSAYFLLTSAAGSSISFTVIQRGNNQGIVEPEESSVSLFPNPGNGDFEVESESTMLSVAIHDMAGRSVTDLNIPAPGHRVALHVAASGMYTAFITTTTGRVVKKILVVR